MIQIHVMKPKCYKFSGLCRRFIQSQKATLKASAHGHIQSILVEFLLLKEGIQWIMLIRNERNSNHETKTQNLNIHMKIFKECV